MTKQTKWPTHVRHHRAGACVPKYGTPADVIVTTPDARAPVKLGGYGEARGVLLIAPAAGLLSIAHRPGLPAVTSPGDVPPY